MGGFGSSGRRAENKRRPVIEDYRTKVQKGPQTRN